MGGNPKAPPFFKTCNYHRHLLLYLLSFSSSPFPSPSPMSPPNPTPENDLSSSVYLHHNNRHPLLLSCDTVPSPAICILVLLFLFGIAISLFILVAVHNALLLISLLLLFAFVVCFIWWNSCNLFWNGGVAHFVKRFPSSDLRSAREGQLVKVTGLVSCENHSLESSYEKISRCVYTSTLVYECDVCQAQPSSRFKCSKRILKFAERFAVDFYITDAKSGLRVIVKAGYTSEVIPLISESTLVSTTTKKSLSSTLAKWLDERGLSASASRLCLVEGYVKEGSSLTVIGTLSRHGDAVMIVPPSGLISTGCLLQKLLLPVDIDGLILSAPRSTNHAVNV